MSPKLLVYLLVTLPLAAQVPPDVPSEYQAIYANMTTQIGAFQSTINASWDGKPYPVAWAPHLCSAESDQFMSLLNPGYYNNTVLPELLQIQATGAKAVTVHISFPILYQPFYVYSNNPALYTQFVSFFQQLATDVHARGMKLVTEITVAQALDGTNGADFEPYYETLDWEEYMTARSQNAVNVAQLIKPDYESILCEPDSEATKAFQPTEDSPTGALQLLNAELAAFKKAGVTGVSVGAGSGSWIAEFTTYIQDFVGTSVDYIDIHAYPVNNSFLTNVLTAATIVINAKKGLGMSEAWANKIANSELRSLDQNTIASRDVFSFWWPIDSAFLLAFVDCSQYEKFLFFSPSYPQYYATYLNYNLVGTESPAQLLPAEFSASAAAVAAGTFNITGYFFTQMIVGVDKTPPVTPLAPTETSLSTTGATITWTPTSDNVGVAGYRIYRDDALISTRSVPPLYDSGLTPGVTYTYTISAFDAQGNVSPKSEPLTITTIDLSPPSVPTHLAVQSDTVNSVTLTWSPSTGGGGVGGYRILRGTSSGELTIIAGFVTGTTYTDPYARKDTTYYYAAESYNLLGITSAPCTPIEVTTP